MIKNVKLTGVDKIFYAFCSIYLLFIILGWVISKIFALNAYNEVINAKYELYAVILLFALVSSNLRGIKGAIFWILMSFVFYGVLVNIPEETIILHAKSCVEGDFCNPEMIKKGLVKKITDVNGNSIKYEYVPFTQIDSKH